jgi:hypothetical protein
MSSSGDKRDTTSHQKTVALAALAAMCHAVKDTNLPAWMQKFINTHVAFHGTPAKNVSNIMLDGFRESQEGMLGRGLYAAHDITKAMSFAEKDGNVGQIFKITFESSDIKVIGTTDVTGLRGYLHNATYSTAAKRSEMAIDIGQKDWFSKFLYGDNPVKYNFQKSSGSLSDRARAGIDEFFIKNPAFAQGTIYVAAGVQLGAAAYQNAYAGATVTAHLLNMLVDESTRMTLSELEEMILGGTVAGTMAGLGVGSVAAVAAGTQQVAQAGIGGMLGYTQAAGVQVGLRAGLAWAGPVGLGVGCAVTAGMYWHAHEKKKRREAETNETTDEPPSKRCKTVVQ